MNKEQYIDSLKQSIKDFPEEEQSEIVSDYNQHFIEGLSKGKTEEEISSKLGDPTKIYKEIKAENAIKKAESQTTLSNVLGAVFATLSLSFFNLVFILGPFLGIAGTIFALCIASISLVIAGPVSIISIILSPFFPNIILGVHPAAAVLMSIGITSLGLLWCIANFYLVKFFFSLTLKYLKWNFNFIKKTI